MKGRELGEVVERGSFTHTVVFKSRHISIQMCNAAVVVIIIFKNVLCRQEYKA